MVVVACVCEKERNGEKSDVITLHSSINLLIYSHIGFFSSRSIGPTQLHQFAVMQLLLEFKHFTEAFKIKSLMALVCFSWLIRLIKHLLPYLLCQNLIYNKEIDPLLRGQLVACDQGILLVIEACGSNPTPADCDADQISLTPWAHYPTII